MNRYPIRANLCHDVMEIPPRLFDILIDDDGHAKIETKREKRSYTISLSDAFRQAGITIEYRLKN